MSIERARELRRNATQPEGAMWRILKPFRDQGYHFRRQVPIGKYYADFASHREKLVIEVDGDSHGTGNGPGRDEVRTEFFNGEGYEVLRFTNLEVMNNADGVYEAVAGLLEGSPTPTLPTRGREKKEWNCAPRALSFPTRGRGKEE